MKTESKRDKQHLRPYGERWNDGKMQISFSFPVAADESGKNLAKFYLEKLGLENVEISSIQAMTHERSLIVAYGCATHFVSPNQKIEKTASSKKKSLFGWLSGK